MAFASISREYVVFPAVTVCNINRLRRNRITGTPYQGIIELDDLLSSQTENREERDRINQYPNFYYTYPSDFPIENRPGSPDWPAGHNSTEPGDNDLFYDWQYYHSLRYGNFYYDYNYDPYDVYDDYLYTSFVVSTVHEPKLHIH